MREMGAPGNMAELSPYALAVYKTLTDSTPAVGESIEDVRRRYEPIYECEARGRDASLARVLPDDEDAFGLPW